MLEIDSIYKDVSVQDLLPFISTYTPSQLSMYLTFLNGDTMVLAIAVKICGLYSSFIIPSSSNNDVGLAAYP
jgi:hypothetical protein